MPKGRNIAILGYTPHKAQAPFEDETCDIAALNDMYCDLAPIPNNRLIWFQIHHWHDGRPVASAIDLSSGPHHPRDPNHVAWLAEAAKHIPVYLREPRPEVPDGRVLDRDAIHAYFGTNYFTNTITYMVAWALMEGYEKIGIYGVDMMMAGGNGSEYGYQRPSCEWIIGMAQMAFGTNGKPAPICSRWDDPDARVVIPHDSDLMKSAFAYGDEHGNVFREKLRNYHGQLNQRKAEMVQQVNQLQAGIQELNGSMHIMEWTQRAWMPGDGDGGQRPGTAPLPNAHKQPMWVPGTSK